MPDYTGSPPRAVLARLSRNRPLVAIAEALEQLAGDVTVRVVGALEIHDGACPAPAAECDPRICVPMVLPRRRYHRGLRRSGGGPPSSSP
jgi:hypothetical protein